MAFQPFQLSDQSGFSRGLDTLSSSMQRAAQNQMRRDQMAAENLQLAEAQKRQRQQDFQAALKMKRQLELAGDDEGAIAIMAPFLDPGGAPSAAAGAPPPGAAPRPGPAPAAPMQPPQGAPPPVGPMGAGPMAAPPMPAPPVVPNAVQGLAHDPSPIATSQAVADEDWMASQKPALSAPTAGEQLVGAAQADVAKGQQGAQALRPRHVGKYMGGQEVTVDSAEARKRRMAPIDEAFSSPELAAAYKIIRPAIAASSGDVDSNEILKYILGDRKAGDMQAHRANTLGMRREQFDQLFHQRNDHLVARLKQSDINSRRAAQARLQSASMMAMPGLKIDAANRGDLMRLDGVVKNYFTQAGQRMNLQGLNALQAAKANIDAQGPESVVAHRDALVQLARFFRGSIPTEGEMKLLYDHVGGVEGKAQTIWNNIATGDISDAMAMNLGQSVKIALEEADHRRKQVFGGLRELVGKDSSFQNMGPQVNSFVRGYAKLAGMDDAPDVIEDTGNPGVVLASGQRPTVAAPKSRTAGPKKKAPAGIDWTKRLEELERGGGGGN